MSDYSKNVRRKDRQETDPEFLKYMLHDTASCSIAVEREGYPLNHIAFFAYDEPHHEIIFHYSRHGFAGQEITDGKKVCIAIHKHGKLYTAARAVDFGCEYQSIIIYGCIQLLKSEQERMEGMNVFFNKFFSSVPVGTYEDFTVHDTTPIQVVKVKIDSWFGKQHRVPEKAITAFYPSATPVIDDHD